MRLKAIAAERAPTIATTIHRIWRGDGRPLAASTAPRKANGSAKRVCSILIISSVKRVFLMTVDTVGQSCITKKHKKHIRHTDTIRYEDT